MRLSSGEDNSLSPQWTITMALNACPVTNTSVIHKSRNKSKLGRDATLSQKLNVTSCRARLGEERGCFSWQPHWNNHSESVGDCRLLPSCHGSWYQRLQTLLIPFRVLKTQAKKKMKLNLLKKKSVILPSGSVQAPRGKKRWMPLGELAPAVILSSLCCCAVWRALITRMGEAFQKLKQLENKDAPFYFIYFY